MDQRSVEWLHLLPPHSELIVGNAPASFSALFDADPAVDNGNGSAYVGWESSLADLPESGRHESIVLVNPRRVTASTLEHLGFSHTRAYSALPSLADARWIVPLDNSRVASSSLRLADPWRLRDRLKKSMLASAARFGQLPRFGDVLLLGRNSKSDLEQKLEESLDCSSVFLALKTGPPRTMRKTTIQVMRDDGRILAYSKLATSDDARTVVEREIDCLRELALHDELAGSLPEILGTLDTSRYFASILSAGPSERGPSTFSEAHREFLLAMVSSTGRRMPLRHSEMWRDMEAKFDNLAPRIPPVWRHRLSSSLHELSDVLASGDLLLSTAHRDFGPWNTRLNPDGSLFVFDWDGARNEMTPLYDMFSFHFLNFKNHSPQAAQSDLPRRMFDVCRKWAPDVSDGMIPYFFLAYLSELGLSRLMGALWRSELESDIILGSIADLLDRQGEWLPSHLLSATS